MRCIAGGTERLGFRLALLCLACYIRERFEGGVSALRQIGQVLYCRCTAMIGIMNAPE